ncbi:MAG: hypothetical protein ACREBD_05600 [Blastocatellia bacterium]
MEIKINALIVILFLIVLAPRIATPIVSHWPLICQRWRISQAWKLLGVKAE